MSLTFLFSVIGALCGVCSAISLKDSITLESILEQAASETSALFHNCSVSIAFANESFTAAASVGMTQNNGDTPTTINDKFVFGSLTKMLTGTSILRHVAHGDVSVDDPIGPLLDPMFARIKEHSSADAKYMNYSTVEDLFGPDAASLTIRQLGKMISGIPDFDTAHGSGYHAVDQLRATMYAEPSHFYEPMEILSLPWVFNGSLEPVGNHSYSSTNFLLLGLILAQLQDVNTWEMYNQFADYPTSVLKNLKNVGFATKGAPLDITAVHGYDMTSYNGHDENEATDISNVDGVFSGWTASDLIGPPNEIVQLVQSIYGPSAKLIPRYLQEFMSPKANESFYGFATFNLTRKTGLPQPEGIAYGHLGATYGYQSIGAYFPNAGEFSLVVATNIETNHQRQPSTGLCKAFNMVRAFQRGEPIPHCEYDSSGYYYGGCNCTVPSN